MAQARYLVEEGMSNGLKEVLWELGSKEPPFDLGGDQLELYRGTSVDSFAANSNSRVYGDGRKMHFTLQRDGYTGAEGFANQHSGEPLIVTAKVPWERIGGELSNSGAKSHEDIEPGKVYFDEPENWIGYNLPNSWIETERI